MSAAKLSGQNIEFLLALITEKNLHHSSFGEIVAALNKRSAVIPEGGDRLRAYFQLRECSDYGLVVESKSGGLSPAEGPAKFKITYSSRHPALVRDRDAFGGTSNIERVFDNAYENGLGSRYLCDALSKAGLQCDYRFGGSADYVGDVIFGKVRAGVHVKLREVPDCPRFPKSWTLEILAEIFPELPLPAPVEKPKPKVVAYGPQLAFNFATVKP